MTIFAIHQPSLSGRTSAPRGIESWWTMGGLGRPTTSSSRAMSCRRPADALRRVRGIVSPGGRSSAACPSSYADYRCSAKGRYGTAWPVPGSRTSFSLQPGRPQSEDPSRECASESRSQQCCATDTALGSRMGAQNSSIADMTGWWWSLFLRGVCKRAREYIFPVNCQYP